MRHIICENGYERFRYDPNWTVSERTIKRTYNFIKWLKRLTFLYDTFTYTHPPPTKSHNTYTTTGPSGPQLSETHRPAAKQKFR